MDINVRIDDYILNCRAVGIIVKDNKILLQKKICDKYFALPGGKIKVGEFGEDVIKREIMEELNIECCVNRINSVCENFFSFNGDRYHQYIFSYVIEIDNDSYVFNNEKFNRDDLIYRWFLIDEIDRSLVKPDYVMEIIKNINGENIKFFSVCE